MPLLDWSSSLIGYREHQLRASRVLGVHPSTIHGALRLAEELQLYTGWMQADAAPAHVVGLTDTSPNWSILAELFVERRVALTEGPVGGEVVFVATAPAHGEPPRDQGLLSWAEQLGQPWLQVIDNEMAFWGHLQPWQEQVVLRWFLEQVPLPSQRHRQVEHGLAEELLGAACQHGLTRNASQVQDQQQALWAGIHDDCPLPHRHCPLLSQVDQGWRIQREDTRWCRDQLLEGCKLDDRRGRCKPL